MRNFWIVFLAVLGTGIAGLAVPDIPDVFRDVPFPDNNLPTLAKKELGRELFFDPILSEDGKISCSSCHHPDKAFTDGQAISMGSFGRESKRSAPSLINVAHRSKLFWHGGSSSLELQALGPLTDHNEHALTIEKITAKLRSSKYYRQRFNKVFYRQPDITGLTQALATFQRSLNSYNSPFDVFQAGDETALTKSQQRGMDLFYGKAECFHCHNGNNFSDNLPHNNAIEVFNEDIGFAQVTDKDEDIGKFITPTLRNIALTAPYMHRGQIPTLRQVLEHYNEGGQANPNSDPLVRPLGLTEQELNDLQSFLESLTDPTIATNSAFNSPKLVDSTDVLEISDLGE